MRRTISFTPCIFLYFYLNLSHLGKINKKDRDGKMLFKERPEKSIPAFRFFRKKSPVPAHISRVCSFSYFFSGLSNNSSNKIGDKEDTRVVGEG
jgi:hypothetical protein